ncbi:MAG: DUF885 domain-containing protein [Acidimicrobiales bacterium]
MPDATLRGLADEYWDAFLEATPTYATLIGDRRFDDRIEDLSVEAEQRQRATWERLRGRVAGLDPSTLDRADRVTAGLLDEELKRGIDYIDHKIVEQSWDQMAGVHVDLMLVPSEYNAPTPENAEKLVERFRQIPTVVAQAVDRWRMALAQGRTPPRVAVERSLNMIDGYLASPVEDDPYTKIPGPDDWDGEGAWREQLVEVTRDAIRPAFQQLRDVFADELAPVVRSDEQSGLQWIPGGPEQYQMLVRQHTSLDLDPADVHATGMAEVTEKLPAEYAEVGQRLFGLTDESEIFERVRTDPTLRYDTADEIMADARRCLDAALAVMGEWFGRLPMADCELKPVPEYAAADSPGAYYFPPAADGSRPGTYYVNLHEPSQKTRYDAAAIAYHEAIPGHHLQLAIASELPDLPAFQRLSLFHTAYAEGWGLYSERLAEEMGLYETDLNRIGMLTADSLRSCRLVLDTGLHTMGWSRQQAIDFMAAHAPMSVEEIAIEVDRYIVYPGQALAYKIGQREIFRLREDAKRRLGGGFDIKGFHDTVLGSSLVTMPILGSLVDDWVTSLEPS